MNDQVSPLASTSHLLARIYALGRPQRRRAENCFWIEGIRHFASAYDAGWAFDTVVYAPILLPGDMVDMLVRRLRGAGVRRQRVTPEQFRSISTAERASGIGAILKQKWVPLQRLNPHHGLCHLIMEEIRAAGNLGTILRTADACGAGGIIFVGPKCDPFDPAVVRASMGGLMRLPLVRTSHEQLRQWTNANRVHVIGLSPEAQALWTDIKIPSPVALVLGEERQGLSPQLRALCHRTASLPMTAHADSLNVGVAAGVMMYELLRRAEATTPCR